MRKITDLDPVHCTEGGTFITNFEVTRAKLYKQAILEFEFYSGISLLVTTDVAFAGDGSPLPSHNSLHYRNRVAASRKKEISND